MEKLEVLVIEDNPKHMSDVKQLCDERIQKGVLSSVDYASTLTEANELLFGKTYDGIISDVFFPERSGEKEREFGTTIAQYALDKKIPFVLVTSTHHHGRKTQPVCDFMRGRGMNLVDSEPEDKDGEAKSKSFKGGFTALMYLREGLKDGSLSIRENIEPDIVYETTQLGIRPSSEYDNINPKIFMLERRREFLDELYGSNETFKKTFDKYCQG